jgi:Fe-S cluster biosynthesis and repair protein YggX
MSQKVFCKKYQKEMPGLSMPPIPGPKRQGTSRKYLSRGLE